MRASRAASVALALLVAAGAFVPATAPAADDAMESKITFYREEAVRISNLDDWLIGVFGPNDDISNISYRWDATCVFTTTGVYSVEVLLQNSLPNQLLRLRSGSGAEMRYEIYTYSQSAASGAFELIRFTRDAILQTNRRGSLDGNCNGGSNLWFTGLIRPGPFNAAPAGYYRDYATIIVRAE